MEKRISNWLVPIMIISIWVFQEIAARTGGFIANLFTYDRIDPYNIFAWISVHHIVQALIALVAIGILIKVKNLDFDLGLGNVKIGLRHTFIFTIIVSVYVLVSYIIGHFIGTIEVYDFPLNAKNVVGTLGFQLLLSGTSEEILFRALPITLLVYSFNTSKYVKLLKLQIPLETIIVALLFSIAHISWNIYPFSINANIVQIVISFIYGIFYGVAYQKSKCVVYPMIMHSISNFLMVGTGYIFAIIYR